MIEIDKSYEIDLKDIFDISKRTLLRMKCQIKYENINHGLIVGFMESLVSYPSGELIFVKLSTANNGLTKIIFSSESMAVNSRLFKKKVSEKNAKNYFELLESNLP